MTGNRSALRRLSLFWLSAWPLWTLFAFASLAAVRMLPALSIRAAVAVPIVLLSPGSLTLGAVFNWRSRLRGLVFACYSVLLSVLWAVFGSLALYVCGLLITAENTYWCLLAISTVLAIAAEMRVLLGRPGKGRRAARKLGTPNPDHSDAETFDAETTAPVRGSVYLAAVAAVAGISLLAGGLYMYDHSSHPVSAGYTWMDWTGAPVTSSITIESGGSRLNFEIIHHQANATTFNLSAAWLGIHLTPLAKSLTLRIGPNQTFHGALFIPPLPNGCTYRVVVELTAVNQMDPLTKKPQTWSINADVYDPSKSTKTCK
jgi:hypothetical protein